MIVNSTAGAVSPQLSVSFIGCLGYGVSSHQQKSTLRQVVRLGGKCLNPRGALSMAPNSYYLFSSLHRSLCGRHSVCLMFCLALFALSLAPITLLETAGAQYVPAQAMCGTDEFIPAA